MKRNQIPTYTTFKRLRVVTLDMNGFMNCSCGFLNRCLMPCTHIYCVLDDINYIQPDLFHIRWWKHFNYMFRVSDDSNYDI